MIRCLAAATLLTGAAGAASGAEPGGLPFPTPGTYKLERIQRVPFGIVREGPGLPHLLSAYTTGKITLLTFFYTLCTDPQGCPLAWNAFEAVREKIKADPVLLLNQGPQGLAVGVIPRGKLWQGVKRPHGARSYTSA
jgi:protein SCO1